jgi:O-antigen/teichoic acid export membrane protein
MRFTKGFYIKEFRGILNSLTWVFFSKILEKILGLVIVSLIAKQYGSEALGIYSLFNSYLIIGTTIALFGGDIAAIKIFPELLSSSSKESIRQFYMLMVRRCLTYSMLISVIILVLFGVKLRLAVEDYLNDLMLYIWVFSIIITNTLLIFNQHVMRVLASIKVFAIAQIIPQLLIVLLIISSLYLSGDKSDVIIAKSISIFISLFVLTYLARRLIFRIDTNFISKKYYKWTDVSKYSWPIYISGLSGMIHAQAGIVIIGYFLDLKSVATYAAALSLATIATFILSTVNIIAAPKFSKHFSKGDVEDAMQVAKYTSKIIFWFSIPLLLILFIFGDKMLSLFYGDDYQLAYTYLLVLSVGQFINAISGPNGSFMKMTGCGVANRNIVFFSTVLNIFLSIVFVYYYGVIGAAIAFTITLSVINILSVIYIYKKFGFLILGFPLLKL